MSRLHKLLTGERDGIWDVLVEYGVILLPGIIVFLVIVL